MFIDKERTVLSSFALNGIEQEEIPVDNEIRYKKLVNDLLNSDKKFALDREVFKGIKFYHPIKFIIDFDLNTLQVVSKDEVHYSSLIIEKENLFVVKGSGRFKIKISEKLFNLILSNLKGNIYVDILGNDSPAMFLSEWREKKKDDFGYIYRQEWIIVAPIVD